MTVLYYPDARLRRRATMLPGSAFATPGLERYAAGMMADLAGVEMCDVLAGPQVDFDPPWRVLAFVAKYRRKFEKKLVVPS